MIELYYVNGSAIDPQVCDGALAVWPDLDPMVHNANYKWPDDDIEYYGKYPSLEEAIDAAEAEGLGLWFTSTDDDDHYTGRIVVAHHSEPEYSPI